MAGLKIPKIGGLKNVLKCGAKSKPPELKLSEFRNLKEDITQIRGLEKYFRTPYVTPTETLTMAEYFRDVAKANNYANGKYYLKNGELYLSNGKADNVIGEFIPESYGRKLIFKLNKDGSLTEVKLDNHASPFNLNQEIRISPDGIRIVLENTKHTYVGAFNRFAMIDKEGNVIKTVDARYADIRLTVGHIGEGYFRPKDGEYIDPEVLEELCRL